MFKRIKLAASLFLFLMLSANFAIGRDNPDISYGPDHFLSVRGDGTIYNLDDQGDTAVTSPGTSGSAFFTAIAYGNNTYVAVAEATYAWTSTVWYLQPNGQWAKANFPKGYTFYGITYAKGVFVIVGAKGAMAYSTDGINWQPPKGDLSEYDATLNDVVYANGVFVAVGKDYRGGSIIFTSSDGMTWNPVLAGDAANGEYGQLRNVAYANNTFVAVGFDASIYVSNDNARTWNNVSASNTNFYAVTYGNGVFVAVGDNSSVWYSQDGSIWHQAKNVNGGTLKLYDVTFGKGEFVAVGDWNYSASTSPIWHSADGVNWTAVTTGEDGDIKIDPCYQNALPYFESVYFDGNNFVATQRTQSIYLPEYYSPDGVNWYSNQNPSNAGSCGGRSDKGTLK